jgi:hypothetical protein
MDTNATQVRDTILKTLVEQAERLGKDYGDYWRTRAEALLLGKLTSSAVNDSRLAMDLLLAEVRQIASRGDEAALRAAVDKLLKARDQQMQANRGAAALSLASQAAALLRELKDWPASVAAVAEVATKFKAEAIAAQTHFWAVEAQIQQLRQQPGDNALRQGYTELLRQQLRLWPESVVSIQARQWLRDWCRSIGQDKVYVETLQEMIAGCSDLEIAAELLIECVEQLMRLPLEQRAKLVALWLNPTAKTSTSALSHQVALSTVIFSDQTYQLFLGKGSDRQQNWREFQTGLQDLPDTQLTTLLACAAAVARIQLQLPIDNQTQSWNKLSPVQRGFLSPALVDALDSLAPPQRQTYWQWLQLESDWADEIDPSQPLLWKSALYRIAISAGDTTAFEKLSELAKQNPREGVVQLMWAYALAQRGDLTAAKKQVTQLAGLSAVGSPLQLAARWALMRFQQESGQAEAAAQAAKLLLAAQPELPPLWQSRFKEIAGL